jgi:hypothetical protein
MRSTPLREEMRRGQPIGDAGVRHDGSLASDTGVLRMERNLLRDHG